MVFSHLFHFLVSWILLWIFLLVTRQNQFFNFLTISSQLLAIFLLVIFTCGLSLICSSLDIYFRDVNFFVQALVLIWFYATPIIYPLNMIPKKYLWIFYLNPLSGIFGLLQQPLTNNHIPTLILIAQIGVIGAVGAVGIFIFKRLSRNFSDWV